MIGFFSPSIVYFFGFVVPFLLVFLGFSIEVNMPSEETLEVLVVGMMSFYLGIFLIYMMVFIFSNNFYVKIDFSQEVKLYQEKRAFQFLAFLYVISLLALWYEFYVLGSLPLLSSNVEELRFMLQVNGYIHLLAISNGFISFLFFCYYLVSSDSKMRFYSLFLISFSIFSLLMTANRLDFMYPLFLMVVAYLLYKKTISLRVLSFIISMVLLFVIVNMYRSSMHSDQFLDDNIYGMGEGYPVNQLTLSLYPFYMTLTYSFEMLGKLVDNNIESITNGYYTFFALHSLLPGKEESFGEFKNRVLEINFYAELTSTYLSNFYVDFGLFGVAILSMMYGSFVQAVWCFYRKNSHYFIVYAVVVAPLFFAFYAFYYMYFYALYQLFLSVIFVHLFLTKEKV